MRFVVLLLLVILLPLRGGFGNAMAAGGPHHGNVAVHQQATDLVSAAQDCLGHSSAHGVSGMTHAVHDKAETHSPASKAETADNAASAADAACDACSACQTCHAVGLVFSDTAVQSLPVPHAQPASLSQHFASAPALRDQKPPIS